MSDATVRTAESSRKKRVLDLLYGQTMLIILILLVVVMSFASKGFPVREQSLQHPAAVLPCTGSWRAG